MTRCLCGLLTKYHRDARNRSLGCAEARRRHPRASVKAERLLLLLKKAKQTELGIRRVSF